MGNESHGKQQTTPTQVEHEIGGGERVDESGQYFAHTRHHSDQGVVDLQHVAEHADREHRACVNTDKNTLYTSVVRTGGVSPTRALTITAD